MKRKKTDEEVKALEDVLADPTKSKKEKENAIALVIDDMMNPVVDTDFKPDTFDAMEGSKNFDLMKRVREVPQRRLPNPHAMKPKKIREGQMIGMYESKQDLYLLIAWLSERVSDLEDWKASQNP